MSEGGPDLSIVELPAAEGRAQYWGVAGQKELEGLGRECDLPRKTDGSLVRRHGIPHVFYGVRWKRLRSHDEVLGFGAHNVKR